MFGDSCRRSVLTVPQDVMRSDFVRLHRLRGFRDNGRRSFWSGGRLFIVRKGYGSEAQHHQGGGEHH
jgi:hypothetical protein